MLRLLLLLIGGPSRLPTLFDAWLPRVTACPALPGGCENNTSAGQTAEAPARFWAADAKALSSTELGHLPADPGNTPASRPPAGNRGVRRGHGPPRWTGALQGWRLSRR